MASYANKCHLLGSFYAIEFQGIFKHQANIEWRCKTNPSYLLLLGKFVLPRIIWITSLSSQIKNKRSFHSYFELQKTKQEQHNKNEDSSKRQQQTSKKSPPKNVRKLFLIRDLYEHLFGFCYYITLPRCFRWQFLRVKRVRVICTIKTK